jgi:hypothetical protein
MKDLAKRAILASGALRWISPSAGTAILLMYPSVMPDPAAHADSLGGIIHSETQVYALMELLSRDHYPISNRLGIPARFYGTVHGVEERKLPWPSRLRFAFRKPSSGHG